MILHLVFQLYIDKAEFKLWIANQSSTHLKKERMLLLMLFVGNMISLLLLLVLFMILVVLVLLRPGKVVATKEKKIIPKETIWTQT